MLSMYSTLFGLEHLGKLQGIGTSIGLIASGLGPLLFNISK